MSALDLFLRKVSAFDFGNGNERESELRRLVAPCRQMDAAAQKAFASSNAAALNAIVKLAASTIPPQHAAQLFAVCHVAIGALEQLRPALKRVALADILKLQFNLAVQAIAMQQFAAAERFVDSQLTTFRESRTAVGSALSESEFAALSATMYQHASLRSVGKRLPADDAARALAFLLVAPSLADSAAADARRLVRSAAATSGATPADAARAVHAVLGLFKCSSESSTGKSKKASAKQAPSDGGDENACLPRSTDSAAARAFVCRLFVQKATCVAQTPTKNRLNTVLHDGAIWFASLVKDSSRAAFYGCSPVALATLLHAIADVALKCADEKQLHAACCETVDEIQRAHSLEAAASSLVHLARQRLSLARGDDDGTELAVEALGNASQFAAIDDDEFLFEFVLGVEALRGELARSARSVPSALLELLDAAIARGAELDRAARRDDGRFVRLAQRRGTPRAEQVVQRTTAAVNQLVSQPTASAQAALSALQTAASTLNAASADAVDIRAQAKLGGTAFNGGVALYNAGRFQESAETLGVAATTLLAVVRAMQETRAASALPLAQVSKAFYMLALAHQRAEHDTEALDALRQAMQLHPHLFERSAEADDAALAELRPLIELYCVLEAQCEQFLPIHVFVELDDNVPVSVVAGLLDLQLSACPSVAAYAGEARVRLFEELITALDGDMWAARRFAVRGRLAALLHELNDGDALAALDSAVADAKPLVNNKRKRLSGMEQAVAQLLCWRVILVYADKEELDEQSLRAALDGVMAAMHEGRSVAALAQQCAELFDSVADLCAVCGRGDLELKCRAVTVRCWECSATHDWPTSRAPSAASQVQWATALATRGNRTAAQAVFARVKSFIENSAGEEDEEDGDDVDDVDDAAELAESKLFADLRNAMLTQPAHTQAQVARDPAERATFSSASTAVSYEAERLLALAVAEQTCVHAAAAGAGAIGHEASLVPIVRARAAFDGARRAHAHAARRAAPNTLAWTERRAAAMQIEALLALGRGYEGCAAVDEALRCYTKAEEVASQRQCVGHLGVRARVMVARARALSGAAGADATMPPLDTASMIAAGVRGLETLLLVVDHYCCNDDPESARAALAQLDAVLAALVAQNADMLRDLDAPEPEARAAQDYETWSAAAAMRRVLLKLAGPEKAAATAEDARALVHEYHNGHLSCSDLALLHAAIGASESLRSALALCVGAGDALLLPRVASCAALEHVELGSKRGFEVVPAMLQHLSIGASIRHRALLATLDDSSKLSLSSSCVAVGGGSSSCNSSSDDVGELADAFGRMNVGDDERSNADALRAVCSFSGDAALALEALSAKPSRPLPIKLQSWLAPITAAQLAQRWALVTVSVCRERNALVISRREPGGAVMYIVRRDVTIAPHVAAFEELLRDSHASMVGSEPPESSAAKAASSTTRRKRVDTNSSSDEKAEWWKARRALDERLQALLATIESELFGPWICLLEGASSVAVSGDTSVAESAAKALRVSDDMSEDLLRRLLDCSASLSIDAMRAALRDIAGSEPGADIERALKLLRAASKSSRRGVAREAVVLVLDDQLQALPLESMPTMRETSASRLPSMALGRALCERAVRSDAPAHFDANKLFYVLNPAGDLKNTQQRFEAFVLEHDSWNGHIGNAPSEQAYVDALRERDVVIYMGHNCAERVAAPPAVSKLAGGANAVAWVLGCSSARLERRGAFGVHGSALAYLVAGCPAFVGCLWDVTDGDCDKFSQAALDAWLGGGVPLASAVRLARDKCIMQSLVGAAPVVYGLPHWTC